MNVCNLLLFQHGFGVVFCIPLIVALVLYAQKGTSANQQQCASRDAAADESCGFEGDADAYGLGIRLGIYLQWISWYLVTEFVTSDERSLIVTMSAFDTALLVAILVLTFDARCTYAIEIIIMLFIIFTTLMLTALTKSSLDLLQRKSKQEEEEEEQASAMPDGPQARPGSISRLLRSNSFVVSPDQSKNKNGYTAATGIVGYFALTYSAWFWVRMAAWPHDTFAQTPCGTTIFFLAPVKSTVGIKVISALTAAASIILLLGSSLEALLKQWFSVNAVFYVMLVLILPIITPFLLVGGLVATALTILDVFWDAFRKSYADLDSNADAGADADADADADAIAEAGPHSDSDTRADADADADVGAAGADAEVASEWEPDLDKIVDKWLSRYVVTTSHTLLAQCDIAAAVTAFLMIKTHCMTLIRYFASLLLGSSPSPALASSLCRLWV